MLCKHCHRSPVNRPRGLCWTCYYTPGVRELHPSTSKFARRGVPNFCGKAAPATAPTEALPGSAKKVEVLELRAKMRQELWHPQDATLERPAPIELPIG